MTRDIINHDDWDQEDENRAVASPRVQRSSGSGGGGGHATLKDYVIVALIAFIAVMGINNYLYARTGNGTGSILSGGGGCGSCGAAVAGLSNEEMEQAGLAFYFETTGDEDVESVRASVQDFGCHQEIYIYKDDQQVMRVGYANGEIYQL
jgi:hypothetical protein